MASTVTINGKTKNDFITPSGDKLSLLVQSNLLDLRVEMEMESRESAHYKVRFVSFCIHFFNGDLSVRVDQIKLVDFFTENNK